MSIQQNDDEGDGLLLVAAIVAVTLFAAIIFTVVTVVGLLPPAGAHGAGSVLTDRGYTALAECESGNDPGADTGNGFVGAVQWLPSTWDAAAVAAGRPDLVGAHVPGVDPATQQRIAKVWWWVSDPDGQWPVCHASAVAAMAADVLGPRVNSFGRAGDERHECNPDGRGDVRVVRRANRLYVDSLNNGHGYDVAVIGYGRADDDFSCEDLDGDGADELVVWRGDGPLSRSVWSTGIGTPTQGATP